MTKAALQEDADLTLRLPDQVMRLDRMGASHQTRLSFMRTLIRRMASEKWRFERMRFDVDDDGYGVSVFAAHGPDRTYSLIAFTQPLAADQRTDRVIATAWDATFNLFDGIPTDEDIARLAINTPLQEAGRFTANELSLARANKSLRAFEHIVSALAQGHQPDVDFLARVGYLMRTTAVYGSGKYGCADRAKIMHRPETRSAFQVEMLHVYLIRWFTMNLVEHIARQRGGDKAVSLDPAIKRFLGIGNATGLGMAPFLLKHPLLVNRWVTARETALARVRSLPLATPAQINMLKRLTKRARQHVAEWTVEDQIQQDRIVVLREEITQFKGLLDEEATFARDLPWHRLCQYAEDNFSLEGQELVVSLLLEPHGDLIDNLADSLYADQSARLEPAMHLGDLRDLIGRHYDWVIKLDFSDPAALQHFWYYSEDKLEPRLGNRQTEPGADKEMPLAIARDIAGLFAELAVADKGASVAAFVLANPQHRHLIRRIQTMAHAPYGEVRDNLVATGVRPLDLLRFKLAFFGASKFDPKSDLWTRVTLFQGAPMPDELDREDVDDWAFPIKPEAES